MKPSHSWAAFALATWLLCGGVSALAGEGHDHGDAKPAAVGSALPRFSALSEMFELVGVLDGKTMTLYLDRFADNAPVRGAQIELEIAGVKFKAAPKGDEAYEVVLNEALKPGVLPITATLTAGAQVDLLAGELDLHEAVHSGAPAHEHSWKETAGWAAGGLAVLVVLGVLAFTSRRLMATRLAARRVRAGGAT